MPDLHNLIIFVAGLLGFLRVYCRNFGRGVLPFHTRSVALLRGKHLRLGSVCLAHRYALRTPFHSPPCAPLALISPHALPSIRHLIYESGSAPFSCAHTSSGAHGSTALSDRQPTDLWFHVCDGRLHLGKETLACHYARLMCIILMT